LAAKEFCKSVRLVTMANNLQQNSIEISILPPCVRLAATVVKESS